MSDLACPSGDAMIGRRNAPAAPELNLPELNPQHDPAATLRALLARPAAAAELDARRWDLVVRLARKSGVLARLHHLAAGAGVLERVPEAPRRHLEGAARAADAYPRDARIEVDHIMAALRPLGVPVVVMKGGAYVLAGLPAAAGRSFSDIDVLIPGEALAEAERLLRRAGWAYGKLTSYDERYYRDWMHQLPPLTHGVRGTTVDVHHSIAARTKRVALDPGLLLAAAVPVDGDALLRVPSPEDLVLHSATHLFDEGQFERGLRDLDDMARLMRHFAAADPGFWERLVARAERLDLRRQLWYALRYAARLLEVPVPAAIAGSPRLAPPGAAQCRLMDALMLRALAPDHPATATPATALARFLLYVRSHAILMPPHLLVPHLARKAWMRFSTRDDKE